MTYDDIRNYLQNIFGENSAQVEELNIFIECKSKFIDNQNDNTLLDMQSAYVNIYETLKILCFCGKKELPVDKFYSFVACLKADL